MQEEVYDLVNVSSDVIYWLVTANANTVVVMVTSPIQYSIPQIFIGINN